MEVAIKEMFNQTLPKFIERSAIHDLCSKQIGSVISRRGWVTKKDDVLDFGCGVGSFSMTLHKQIPFNSCLGVDSAENMIEWFDKQKSKNGLDSTFLSKCVFIDSPGMLGGKQFDSIISLKAFHHIPDPLACIKLLKTYLKPHGRLVISDLVLDDHSPQYHRSIKEQPCCHGFTVEEMKTLLVEAGLTADVETVDMVHYLECLDQEEAKHRYERLQIPPCDILQTNPSDLPAMYRIGDTYFEKDVFPFLVACGQL